MNREEHNKIISLIEKKKEILLMKKKYKTITETEYLNELDKFEKLQNLIADKYHNFFSDISFDVAVNILEDIGLEHNDAINSYVILIKEIKDSKYTLVENLPEENLEMLNN